MPGCPEQHQKDISKILEKFRDSWSAEESAATVPSALSDLLDKAFRLSSQQPLTTATASQRPDEAKTGDDVAAALVSALSNIARLTLATSGKDGAGFGAGRSARARTRALALECLGLGVQHLFDGNVGDGVWDDVLGVAAAGASDDRWGVRVAAAKVAGAVVKKGGGQRLLELLSSKQGCWLPALLADGHPDVEEAARATLSLTPASVEGHHHYHHAPTSHAPTTASPLYCSSPRSRAGKRDSQPESRSNAASTTVAAGAASAAMCGACSILRAATTLAYEEAEGTEQRFVDLAKETSTLAALRALRGACVLVETATAMRIEALETVEAWLASTVTDPPMSPPWAEGVRQSAAASAGALGNGLAEEARDAIRALLCIGTSGGVEAAAATAAASAVEAFKEECCRAQRCGSEGEHEEEGEDDVWRSAYCGLLVRLEAVSCSAEPTKTASPSIWVEGGEEVVTGASMVKPAMAEDRPARSPQRQDGVATTSSDDSDPIGTQLYAASLTAKLAEALQEVPFAHQQALPSSFDDDKASAMDKKALRIRGHRRQRWMVASAHLLLRAGMRLCVRHRQSIAAAGARGKDREAETIKLLLAAMAFHRSSTTSDGPAGAWLSCVRRPDSPSPKRSATPPLPPPPPAFIPSAPAKSTTATDTLADPIPWEACVQGSALPIHALPAPWAGDPLTVKLATELVDAAWCGLSLGEDGRSPGEGERNAEALVQALRVTARERGGWREEAGVGVKHAVAGVVRRLRFPLVAGATLGHALPLVLPLADDYDPAHQAVGFSLVLHLAAEAMPTELAWHRGLLLEVLERGLRGGGRDPTASMLCLAAAVRLLGRAPKGDNGGARRAGFRIARQALSEAGRTSDGAVRLIMVCGAAGLLELPGTSEGYAPCELLRPALLCLLPILQSCPISARLDARPAALRALNALCLACWPRVHAHAAKMLCALLWTCGDCLRRASNGTPDNQDGAAPLGVVLLENRKIDASADEKVRDYSTRLGALVLLLAGDAGRSTLREACGAVRVLRPVGLAMEELADRVLEGSRA